MPQAATYAVNNGAGTPVSKTFTLVAPAAGVGGTAQWELQEGAIPGAFVQSSAVLRNDPSIKGQSSVMKIKYPSSYVDSTTSLTLIGPTAEAVVTIKMPDAFPEDQKANFVAYIVNTVQVAIWKEFLRGRVAMT